MSRAPLIVGNWKMHKSGSEAAQFILSLSSQIQPRQRRVCLAPAFTAIEAAVSAARGTGIQVGAQNAHDAEAGAFTGEVSLRMLKAAGAQFVILGHSERRQILGETDAFIHRKVLRALEEGVMPILCVGELSQEREAGHHEEVLKRQLSACLQDLSAQQVHLIAIAYEPVWAIGTGKTASPAIAQAMHRLIRSYLESNWGRECAESVCLLYGGSVSPDNVASLMQQTDIDGVLVGGASLDVDTFIKIVNF
jgi:triosephosphate isomerase